MNSREIIPVVLDVLSKQLHISEESILPVSHLEKQLGADSLDYVEIIMSLEEEFDIEIDDPEVEGVVTVADIIKLLEAKRAKSTR